MFQPKAIKPVRKYEAVVIMHPDASDVEQKKYFNRNKEILKQFKGEYHQVDTWGKRRLANPIRKFRMGTYFHAFFEAEAEAIMELERTARINDRVLRFIHSRLEDRKAITDHVQAYRDAIKASIEREKDRDDKAKARKSMRRPSRPE